MATLTQDTTIGTTAGFLADVIGGVQTHTRRELTGTALDQLITASGGRTTLTIPTGYHYVCGPVFSNSRNRGGSSINPNGNIDLVVEAGSIFEFTTTDSQQWRSGTINIQGTAIHHPNGNSVYPGNRGNGEGITSLIINGTFIGDSSIVHGRALSPTATVDLSGATFLGTLGFQLPISASYIDVSVPDPGLSTDDQNSEENNRFLRYVQPSIGDVLERWSVIKDGTWNTTSQVIQINREQYTNETTIVVEGDSEQFTAINSLRIGSNTATSDGAIHQAVRVSRWNPRFIDDVTGAVVTDVSLNMENAGQRAYPVPPDIDKVIPWSLLPHYGTGSGSQGVIAPSGDDWWILNGFVIKTTPTTGTSTALNLNARVDYSVFSFSFSHISRLNSLTTEHHKTGETTTYSMVADASLNDNVVDEALVGVLRAPVAIRPGTPITDSRNIYAALKFAKSLGDENLGFSVTADEDSLTFATNFSTGLSTISNASSNILNTIAFDTTNGLSTFILAAPDGNDSLINDVDITGDLTIVKHADDSNGHLLNLRNATVSGKLTLQNDSTNTLFADNLGVSDNTYGSIDIGNDATLTIIVNTDATVDLDTAWGPQTYGTNVTIENLGTGRVSLLSSTAGAASVTAGAGASFLERATFVNASAAGSVLRIYNATGFNGSSTEITESITPEESIQTDIVSGGSNYVAVITAPGFVAQTIETGLLNNSATFLAPTLTPDPLANADGIPVDSDGDPLYTVATTPFQAVGTAGTVFIPTGAAVRASGTVANRIFTQAVGLQGYGRGLLLNWIAEATRSRGVWVQPADPILTFPGANRVNISDNGSFGISDGVQQLFHGINEDTNGVFNTTSVELTVPTVNSISNPTPDANIVASRVSDDLGPDIVATRIAAESAEAELKNKTI